MKKIKKKPSPKKRLGDRRKTDRRRRRQRQRLKKEPTPRHRRAAGGGRRTANRRSGVRRKKDTYMEKIKEFQVLAKPGVILPPLEEEVVTDDRETVAGFETPASEDAPEPTDLAPEPGNS